MGRLRTAVIIVLATAAAALATASSAGALTWSAPEPVAGQAPFTVPGSLSWVACPSARLCVATDLGNVVTSTDPTGGPASWRRTNLFASGVVGFEAVSCPSTHLCVATGCGGEIATSTDPAAGAGSWQRIALPRVRLLPSLSCPSARLCVAPDASAWRPSHADPALDLLGAQAKLTGVACASDTECVAVDSAGNAIVGSG